MSISKKAMITLAAALITAGFSSASFAALEIHGVYGESYEGSTGPELVCYSIFGVSICFST